MQMSTRREFPTIYFQDKVGGAGCGHVIGIYDKNKDVDRWPKGDKVQYTVRTKVSFL